MSVYTDTLGEVLAYIDEVLPNSLTTSLKVTFINDEIKEIWRDMSPKILYEFTTVEDQTFYDLPDNYTFDQIYEDGLKVAKETGAVDEDTEYNTYSFCGSEDELIGYRFFNGMENNFGIYPEPDDAYNAKIKLLQYPTLYETTDTDEVIDLNKDYIKLLKLKVIARVAKTGTFPRVDLANNYTMDAMELEKKMKYYTEYEKFRDRRRLISYKEGWNQQWLYGRIPMPNLSKW